MANRKQTRVAKAKARRASFVVSPRKIEKQKTRNRRATKLAREAKRNG